MGLFDNGIEPDDPCPHNTVTSCDHCRQGRQLRDALFDCANMARCAASCHDKEHLLNALRRLRKRVTDAARSNPQPVAWQ
jgi:hypothetical protein